MDDTKNSTLGDFENYWMKWYHEKKAKLKTVFKNKVKEWLKT